MRRKINLSFTGWIATIFATLFLVTVAGTFLFPAVTRPVRALIVLDILLGLLVLTLLGVRLVKRSKIAAIILLLILAVALVGAKPTSRQPDVNSLRTAYLQQLDSFSGTRYYWGGESHQGVDCSGLARTALWQAMVNEGLRTRNTRLLGPILWRFWWHDLGARDIDACNSGYTHGICSADQLAGFTSPKMLPGDVAVVGPHVLVYVGDSRWIEANPDDQLVVTNKATADSRRTYFQMPARIFRWWIFTRPS